MKALVLEENGKLAWREHELRRVDGWYRMRVAAAGICGSDLGRGFKGGAYHYPLVMGHEFSAVVEETPAGGKYAPGTLAAVYPLLPCGKCAACSKGYIQLCEHYDYFGSRRDGAFAEELYVPVISFNIAEVSSQTVADLLSEDNIAVRAGLHCAPCAHKKIGTENIGTVRISPGYFNTAKELNALKISIKKICENRKKYIE